MKYDVDYFIRKFEAIPENKWITRSIGIVGIDGAHCAYGHCGVRGVSRIPDEAIALSDIFTKAFNGSGGFYRSLTWSVVNINDISYKDIKTPKQRILAALYDIKKMQQPEEQIGKVKERIVYVSVPESIVNQSKELILQ